MRYPSDTSESTTENEPFKSAVFQRLFAITVPARSKDAVLGLVSKLQTVLEGIVLQGASGMFTACVSTAFLAAVWQLNQSSDFA